MPAFEKKAQLCLCRGESVRRPPPPVLLTPGLHRVVVCHLLHGCSLKARREGGVGKSAVKRRVVSVSWKVSWSPRCTRTGAPCHHTTAAPRRAGGRTQETRAVDTPRARLPRSAPPPVSGKDGGTSLHFTLIQSLRLSSTKMRISRSEFFFKIRYTTWRFHIQGQMTRETAEKELL